MATIQETFNKYLNGVYSDCFKNTNGTNYTRNYCDSFGKDMSSYFDCKKTTIHSLTKPVKFDAESLNVGGRFKTDTAFNIKEMKLTESSVSFRDQEKKECIICVPIYSIEITDLLSTLFCECVNDLDLEQLTDTHVVIDGNTIFKKFLQIKNNFDNIIAIKSGFEKLSVISNETNLNIEEIEELGIYDILSNNLDTETWNSAFENEYINLQNDSTFDFTVIKEEEEGINEIYLDNINLTFHISENKDFNSMFWLNRGELTSSIGKKITFDEEYWLQTPYLPIDNFSDINIRINCSYYNISDPFDDLFNNSYIEVCCKDFTSLYHTNYSNVIIFGDMGYVPAIPVHILYHDESINFKNSLKNSNSIVMGDVSKTYNDSQTLSTAIVSSYNFIDTFTISSDNNDLYDLINTTLYR